MATPSSIRIPVALRGRIEARAVEERRSFSNMVVFLLERGLELEAEVGGPVRVSAAAGSQVDVVARRASRDADEVRTDFK